MSNSEQQKTEIQPACCPWCGKLPVVLSFDPTMWIDRFIFHETWSVRCRNELCWVCPRTREFDDRESAVTVWNTRAVLPSEGQS